LTIFIEGNGGRLEGIQDRSDEERYENNGEEKLGKEIECN